MYGSSIKLLRVVLGVGVLLLGLSGVAQAKKPKHDDLSAEHGALGTQIGNVPTEAEMTAQHDMIKQGVDDARTDIAEVKALVEGLTPAAPAPVCPVAGGTPDASGRYVTYEAGGGDPKKVCDTTTGLYWEQSPSGSTFTLNPDTATPHCTALGAGWRVPAVQELVGVVDYTVFSPAVNTSVFSNVQSNGYWSATTNADFPTNAWFVSFGNGDVGAGTKAVKLVVWCARSGS